MSDDYLWDRSGEPDPEVQKLERSLARLGHGAEPLELPEDGELPAPEVALRRAGTGVHIVWRRERPKLPGDARLFGVPARFWAAAAVVIVIAGAVGLLVLARRPATWPVARLDGTPRVGERAIGGDGRLAVGDWLVTDATSRARVTVGSIGEVVVEPNTRLRLVAAGAGEQRLHLAVGTVMAVIVAPPRQFVVETPTARAVDLGCAYTLEVDPSGAARVTVLAGWVSFEREGNEAFIPAGARCATRPGFGPGTPYFTDASYAFKNALTGLDVTSEGDPARGARLADVLAEARREDALTLWHLLARLAGAERDAVFERLAALVPPPPGVTRAGVLGGDREMLDRWWDELGFGEMKWWRLWQRSWPESSAASPGPS